MSFLQIREMEDSINNELERQIEMNQSIKREHEEIEQDIEFAAVIESSDENDLHLTFDLSYGNFSFQTSLEENRTPLRSIDHVVSNRLSHSTPVPIDSNVMRAGNSRFCSSDSPPVCEIDPEKPVFDPNLSFDSPLPLRERLKRGLL